MTHQVVSCVSAILINHDRHILFQQRDNKPTIHFPNYWALFGGHVEAGEQPEAAMYRELFEEIEFTGRVHAWLTYDFWRDPDVLVHQHIFYAGIDQPIADIRFHEGQAIRFMTHDDLDIFQIGFGFDNICKDFLKSNIDI